MKATGKSGRGLTLIEFMIGLAVVAILSALAVPAMGLRLERQRLAMAAEALAAELTEARFEAARSGQPQRLTAVSGAGPQDWCWAIQPVQQAGLTDCRCAQTRSCGYRSVAAKDHPQVRLPQARPLLITPEGTGMVSTAAVFESPSGERLRVDVLALGRARICAPTGAHMRYASC